MKLYVAAAAVAAVIGGVASASADEKCFDKSTLRYVDCPQPAVERPVIVPAPIPEPPKHYITGFGAYAFPQDIEADGSILGGLISGTADADLENGFVAGGAIGTHIYQDIVRAEIELSYQSFEFEDATLGNAVGPGGPIPGSINVPLNGDISALMLLVNGWYDIHTGTPFVPYLGGGVGLGFTDVDARVQGAPVNIGADGESTSFAFQVGAGVNYELTENFAIGIGYRFRGITDVEAEGQLLGGITKFDDASLYSHSVQGNLTVSF